METITETCEIWLTVPEVAAYMTGRGHPTSVDTLDRRIKNGKLPYTQPGGAGTVRRVRQSDVDKLMEVKNDTV